MSSWMMANALVETLIADEVRDVVLAPGSRSAALAVALERAERRGDLRLHVRVDERGAGFLALGLAKATGQVVPLVCTSGTAVGNLLPSAMEARHAGVPWLALTCDRPAYRVGTGASQTTDQVGILGGFSVANVRLSSSSGRVAYWSAGLRRAMIAARGTRTGRPGPAQVNLEFSNPMLPEDPDDDTRPHIPGLPVAALPEPGPVLVGRGPRSVVLVGDASPEEGERARAFAEAAGYPLLAEPSSNARGGSNAIASYRILLKGQLGSQIERVITFGHPTLSRSVAALLSDQSLIHVVVSERADWPDAGASAAIVCHAVTWQDEPGPREWLDEWKAADRTLMARLSEAWKVLNGYSLAAAVVAAVGRGENLVFGSSNPIRDADLAPISERPGVVWANRGLAGIDGTIATATGIALGTTAPTTVLLGDLTFLHDIGSLALAPSEPRPDLRIVVADDNGGSIFHTLEQGAPEYADSFERVFATAHNLDLAKTAEAFGHKVTRIATREELAAALRRPIRGVEVLLVRIGRGDRRANERWLKRLS